MSNGDFTVSTEDSTLLLIRAPQANYNVTFHKDGGQIGCLDFNGPEMTFTGNADESAKVFFGFVAESFKGRLEEERRAGMLEAAEIADQYGLEASSDSAQIAYSIRQAAEK